MVETRWPVSGRRATDERDQDRGMRATYRASIGGVRRIAPLRQPRSRLAQGDARSDRIEVIRFDWKVKTGIQPVMMVTRRRLD